MSKRFSRYLLIGLTFLVYATGYAQNNRSAVSESNLTLFKNVSIFDGKSKDLKKNQFVLVRGDKIQKISAKNPVIDASESVMIIDGVGKVLMPGLIDAHWHSMLVGAGLEQILFGDPSLTALIAGKESSKTLMRGFTSVRDMGGSVFGLKKAIDQGLIDGPRIWPSGAIVGQTASHADFRAEVETRMSNTSSSSQFAQVGHAAVADGPAEVLRKVREQLLHGASQIKVAAGGGIISAYDPIDVSEYTYEEMKAAVDAASAWNTYVAVHAYTSRSIQTAIKAGVLCIDHGQLMDEETAKIMSEKGIWLSTQPFVQDPDSPLSPEQKSKEELVITGTDRTYGFAKKYHLKTAFGTDILFESKKGGSDQNKMILLLTRWYAPEDILKMVTHDNAKLLTLSGPRSPYPGNLGVIEEGALADILLVKGNPIANIKLLADPQNNLAVIMKGGKIYKNIH